MRTNIPKLGKRWRKLSDMEALRLIDVAQRNGVEVKFRIPPENGGQIVTESYAACGEYGILARSYDASDQTFTYRARAWRDSDGDGDPVGVNSAPA